ncbi:MAG: gliding motility-associated C-terminal domain-containing protein [Bacteroidia bacterium]
MKSKIILLIAIIFFLFHNSMAQAIPSADSVEIKITIPNVFSPNKDGVSDTFYVQKLDNSVILNFELKILNRWGQLLFKSNNIKKGWDGNYKKEVLPQDAYIYQLTIEVFDPSAKINLKKLKYAGTVTLIR